MLPVDPSQAPSLSLAASNALEQQPKAEKVRTSNGGSTVRFRQPTGLFSKKPKAPTAAEVQKATAARLVEVTSEKPKSDYEQILENQIAIAKDFDLERGTSSQKAAEFVVKAAGFSLAKPEEKGSPITTIYIGYPDLPFAGELNEQKPRPAQPSWAKTEVPFADSEVVQQNS
jgi:hypothetical protein